MLSALLESAAGAAASVGVGLFGYSKKNFQYDRRQRLLMEYQLADMRIKQVQLWRQDVRDFMQLTPRKMDVYLLVIALELNATATALCKARVPPGSPSWLCDCHTLAAVSALVYLMLGLWFGLHAFVSAQAYKVRILTQIVRLPIPTWEQLEASRTYTSAYEKMPRNQMLRVPFIEGTQESRCTTAQPAGRAAPSPGPRADISSLAPADPWGMERSGREISELQPGVNTTHTERQQHIWHVREAARFYQTYDAFCRICLSAGTSSLATFFSFFCLSYVLTENAAPVAAWAGMLVFVGISLILLGNDLKITRPQFIKAAFLLASSPLLCSVVTFVSSKNSGKPGRWEWLMPIALFMKGAWFAYYLFLFKVKEMETGALLPTAFRGVLYLDPFGWAKHSQHHWRRVTQKAATAMHQAATMIQATQSTRTIVARPRRWFRWPTREDEGRETLPSMACASPGLPSRPEDAVSTSRLPNNSNEPYVSFRPGTFTGAGASEDGDEASRPCIHGDIPGRVPWHYFSLITAVTACLWWTAAGVAAYIAYFGMDTFVVPQYGLGPREVAPVPLLISERVETSWQPGALERPRGLACDATGTVFATLGRGPDGQRSLLQGHLSPAAGAGTPGARALHFEHRSACSALASEDVQVQDLAIGGRCVATDQRLGDCTASVLQRGGAALVQCPLAPLQPGNATGAVGRGHSLGRAWLEDRGGEASEGEEEQEEDTEGLLQPEEFAALSFVPCAAGVGGAASETGECLAVGTTARRLVLLGAPTSSASGAASATARPLVPRRLLKAGDGLLHGAGAIALFGGRFLALLDQGHGALHVLDLRKDGQLAGVWALPRHVKWASICASEHAFFGMEQGEQPGVWRFPAPKQLLNL